MVDLIAKKQIGRTKPGGKLRVTAAEARVLLALHFAEVPAPPAKPAPAPKTERTYQRRDMVAETPSDPVIGLPPIVTKSADDGEKA